MKQNIERLLELCKESKTILLTGPIFPDGDSIGACLALKECLESKTTATIDLTGKTTFHYRWMNEIDQFKPDTDLAKHYDMAIVLDGDRHRLPAEITSVFNTAERSVLIDHHISTNPNEYDIALLDATSASTCEIIHKIMTEWNVPLSKTLAQALYTGIIFDTGGFRHSNTSPEVHRLTADLLEQNFDHSFVSAMVLMQKQPTGLYLLEHCLSIRKFLCQGQIQYAFISQEAFQKYSCTQGDIEGLVDTLLYVEGVKLACLGIEQVDGRVKISLRSKSSLNVAKLAKSIQADGGGHVRASGAMLRKTLAEAIEVVPTYLKNALKEHQAT
jgi:bifunctional oligoribonuclease and PAP phosphatase NrnA